MPRSAPIAPSFAPGSGWHRRPPVAAPGSDADRDARALAAWPCSVAQLRQFGERIPAEDLLGVRLPWGFLVAEQVGDAWQVEVFENPRCTSSAQQDGRRLVLLDAQLARENEGVRLYRGAEWVGKVKMPQTWLCARDPERLQQVLHAMAEQEAADED